MKSIDMKVIKVFLAGMMAVAALTVSAQDYPRGLVDKTIGVIGNEMISVSQLESEIQMARIQSGYLSSDKNLRCEILERLLESKLFLM